MLTHPININQVGNFRGLAVAVFLRGFDMKRLIFLGLLGALILTSCSGGLKTMKVPGVFRKNWDFERALQIVTLLPKAGIPAIDNPEFVSAEEADSQYFPDERVIGVVFEGDARAYSIPLLSSYEIVNDTVGGRKIAVTW